MSNQPITNNERHAPIRDWSHEKKRIIAVAGNSSERYALARYCSKQLDLFDLHDDRNIPEWLSYCASALADIFCAMNEHEQEYLAEKRMGA